MLLHASTKTERTPGPGVLIDCPACHRETHGVSYELAEKSSILFIPLPVLRETRVECSACDAVLVSSIAIRYMEGLGAYELSRHLHCRVSLVASVAALFSVLFCWVPGFGAIMGLVGLAMSWTTGGWQKRWSIVGTPLSVGVSALMFYWMGKVK